MVGSQPALEASERKARTAERTLFVLWSRSRCHEAEILEAIDERFVVARVVEITWTPALVPENLGRFYLNRLAPPYRRSLVHQKGDGPFLVVEASDPAPRRVVRSTASGRDAEVNEHAHDLKARFRASLGGQMSIHSSDSPEQARREARFLTRLEPASGDRTWDGRIVRRSVDPPGAAGWADWPEFAHGLGDLGYVTLTGPGSTDHPTFLVGEYRQFCAMANARPRDPRVERTGGPHAVEVGGRRETIVVRRVGDRYFSDAAARAALDAPSVPGEAGLKAASIPVLEMLSEDLRRTVSRHTRLPRDPLAPAGTAGLNPGNVRARRALQSSRAIWFRMSSPAVTRLDRSLRTLREALR